MTDFQEVAVKEILRSILGKTAKISLYGREHRTPMTFVLDEVEQQIGARFSVYWVDDGSPEVFTLPDFLPSPVVFSARYLALTAIMRSLLVNGLLKNVLVEVAEGTMLKLMAEMALRYGDPNYAVLAFVKACSITQIVITDLDDATNVEQLEDGPINESYMAAWFYGLAHELGHLSPLQKEDFPDNQIFSDDWILQAITEALDSFRYSDSLKHEAIERAKQEQSNSVLRVENIRSEGLADIFAASILFQTTRDIMQEIHQERFEVAQFIGEMLILLNVVAIIEACRRVASIASATTPNPEAYYEFALHPVSVLVRVFMQRVYLESAIAHYLFNTDHPTPEQFHHVTQLLDKSNEYYTQQIPLLQNGLARAIEFSFFPERRENEWVLLETFRKQLLDSVPAIVISRQFYKLAASLEADSKLLRAFKDIVDYPSKPIHPDPIGDIVYFVPWVEGPNGSNRPFGLDTKHGHLVFAFHDQDELYTIFFEASAEQLKPGFTLKHYLVPVLHKKRLAPELAAHMPKGQSFGIVVEGTEAFEQYMKELADGTIWED